MYPSFQVLRCLRPDRLTTAVADYIRAMLPNGALYLDGDSSLSFYEVLESSFADSTAGTPIFFILSPGSDPVKEIEALGRKMGYTANFNLHNVALGQVSKRLQKRRQKRRQGRRCEGDKFEY